MELTRASLERLGAAFADGATRSEAAEAAGVPRSTLFEWLKRGELEAHGLHAELYEAARLSPRELSETRRESAKGRLRK